MSAPAADITRDWPPETADAAAARLREHLRAERHYYKRFRIMSEELTPRDVRVRFARDVETGQPLILVWVRRVDTTMHHVVGSAIRTLWPGVAYCADVRW